MPTLRPARAVALAVAILAACGERAPTPAAPSAPAAAPPGAPAPSGPSPAMVPATEPAATPGAARLAPAPGTGPAGPAAAGQETAGAPAAAPAGPSPVASVLGEVVAVEPGGSPLPLAATDETVIDPGARFRVVLKVVSDDARLLLLDANDAVVAGEGAHELGQSTKLTFAPSAPLVPGRRYTLRIDGASTRELHGPPGTAFTPASFKVLVAGTPPPPEPKEKPAQRRKRRSR